MAVLLGYVISFVVIGIMWANHHNLMKLIDRVDHGFIILTLLLLLCIAFLPFPTAVMAEHLADPKERSVAVAFYCGCFTVTAVFYFLMWWHAARGRRPIAATCPDAAVRAITRAYAPGSLSVSHRDAAGVRARGAQPVDRRRAGRPLHVPKGRRSRSRQTLKRRPGPFGPGGTCDVL